MAKSKRVFYWFTLVFLLGLFYVSYDIARRTTFPGSKPQLQERIKDAYLKGDSTRKDSLSTRLY